MIPVVISGGGPVGLTAALILARNGIQVTILEKHPGTSTHPRARGLNVRTMEIYRELGLEAPIRQAGLTLEKSRYMLFVESLAGKEIRRVPDAELGMQGDALAKITPCTWCQCAQDELEPILANAAKAYGATLLFNTELISFSQDESSVNLLVKDRGTEEQWQLQAEYLLGADGAKSPVREALHIPFTGRGTLEHFVNIYFRADLSRLVADRWFGICFVENPEFEGIFLAVNNSDRWLLNVQDAVYGHQTPDSYLGRAVDCIRKAVGRADLQPEVISILPWEAAGRVAEQFSDGRVFLAGDAAHIMPPAGGFGLNTGIQDAHNLAWKLTAVAQGKAGQALLETYHQERYPVARAVVGFAIDDLESPSPDIHGRPSEDSNTPAVEQLQAILGYRYTSNAVLESDDCKSTRGLDLTGCPGTRAPHIWLDDQTSTIDLFGKNFVLFTKDKTWREAAEQLSARLDVQIRVQARGDWLDSYGVSESGAVLVRPDGFVAWRSKGTNLDTGRALNALIRVILASDQR